MVSQLINNANVYFTVPSILLANKFANILQLNNNWKLKILRLLEKSYKIFAVDNYCDDPKIQSHL